MPCAGSVGGVLRCRRLHKQSLRRRFPFPWSPQSFHCDARRLRSGRYSIKALDIFNRAMQSCILRAQLRKNAFQIHSPPSTFEGETFRSSLLYFHCEHHPVRYRKQTRPDPRVVSHLQIQRPQSHRIRILVLGIRHRRRSCLHRQTRSYTTLPGLPEAAHEESPNQVQSEDSIFLRHACLGPVPPRHCCVFQPHIARRDHTLGRQRQPHSQCAIPGENTHFQRPQHRAGLYQKLQKRALLWRNLHHRTLGSPPRLVPICQKTEDRHPIAAAPPDPDHQAETQLSLPETDR